MRRRGRVRRVGKWVGLVACLSLVATTAASAVVGVIWNDPGVATISLDGGAVTFAYCVSTTSKTGNALWWSYTSTELVWLPSHSVWTGSAGSVRATWNITTLPPWIPLFVLAIPTAYLWHRDRRPRAGHCQRCGYDLTGNVSGRCSECGAEGRQ
jgi:hypothetical protein